MGTVKQTCWDRDLYQVSEEDTCQPADITPSIEEDHGNQPKIHIAQENPNVSRKEMTSYQAKENWHVAYKSKHAADEVEDCQKIESCG